MIRKSVQNGILLSLNIFFVITIALSLLGSVLNPVKFLLPIYLIFGFPVFVIINILFMITWIFLRRWYFLLSMIVLFLSYNQISTIFPINFDRKDEKTIIRSLVIVSYNTNMNGNVKKHLQNQPNGVIKYLLSTNADIICIQEYFVNKNKTYLTQEDVNKLFKNYPYKYIRFDSENNNRKTGLATFSKYPIIKNASIDYKSIFNASIYSDIVINKDTIRVINNHLESNYFMGNDLLLPQQLEKKFNAENFFNTTMYIIHKLAVSYPIRAKQADKIHEIIKSTHYKLIVCGDFNDIPISYSYTKIKKNLNDAFVKVGTGFGWTFNSPIYKLRLDYVFYDDNFVVKDFQIGKTYSSDHFPVKCVLHIK